MPTSEIREWLMLLADVYVCYILTHEFFWDKRIYEQKRRRIKRSKKTVRVCLEDGQIKLLEKPDEVNFVTEHKDS